MKKFVAGVVCGAVLFAGATVSAGAIKSAIIGKKVDGVAVVTIDGKKVEKDAITIEGTSYLPVRAMTDAIGGTVESAAKGKVEISTKRSLPVDEEELVTSMKINSDIEMAETLIKQAKERIALAQDKIDNGKDLILTGGGTIPFKESDVYAKLTAEIAKENETIAKLEQEITDLKAQKAALEAKK